MPAEATWYHAHQSEIRRSDGQSAVGLASYITGEPLKDERTGTWCSRNHPGEVLDWFSVAPADAPKYFTDNRQLSKAWNDIEKSETYKNAQPAIHWNVAGSREFSDQDHREVALEIANRLSDRYKVIVVVGIHKPTDHGDDRNWHYHFGHNMREVGADGLGKKVREITAPQTKTAERKLMRAMIAEVLQERLERIGSNERVSHLSYKERGIDKEPTLHLGNEAKQLELKGVVTDLGDWNRAVQQRNAERERQKQESEDTIKRLEAEIVDLQAERERRKKPMSLDEQEYKRTEEMKREVRESAEAQEKEYLKAKDRETAERFLKQFDVDRTAAERKRQEDLNNRGGDPEIEDARLRYLESLGKTQGRTTFDTLINAAKDEAATIARSHDKLTREAASESDLDKKEIILLRRDIQHADYMALTRGRLAEVTRYNEGPNPRRELDENGKPMATHAERRDEEKQYWLQQANNLRGELDKRRELYEVRQLAEISNKVEQMQDKEAFPRDRPPNRYSGLDDHKARVDDIKGREDELRSRGGDKRKRGQPEKESADFVVSPDGTARRGGSDEDNDRALDRAKGQQRPNDDQAHARSSATPDRPMTRKEQMAAAKALYEERVQAQGRDPQREPETRDSGATKPGAGGREMSDKDQRMAAVRERYRDAVDREAGKTRENDDVGGEAQKQNVRSRGGRSR